MSSVNTFSVDQIRTVLQAEEPDYPALAEKFGPGALAYLAEIIAGEHSMLASKAAYLAGVIGTESAVPVIRQAAASADVRVRVAAAAAAANLPSDTASDLLVSLVDDTDVGVQKVALRSVPQNPSAALFSRVEALSVGGAHHAVKKASAAAIDRVTKKQ
jgi:hypothetical protein